MCVSVFDVYNGVNWRKYLTPCVCTFMFYVNSISADRFKQAQENRVWTGKLVEEPYTEYILSLYHALMVSNCYRKW